jgi:glutamine synthetase
MFSPSPKAKRLEFRPPDPSCNPYIAFSAMLMAGLDGIQNRIDPGEPLDKDIYDLPPEELANVPSLPGTLDESLKALENDHEFLLRGDVFSTSMIERWIEYKREKEITPSARVFDVLRHLGRRPPAPGPEPGAVRALFVFLFDPAA